MGKVGKTGKTGKVGKVGKMGKVGKTGKVGKMGKVGKTGKTGKIEIYSGSRLHGVHTKRLLVHSSWGVISQEKFFSLTRARS